MPDVPLKGRGASSRVQGRYERTLREPELDAWHSGERDEACSPRTVVHEDPARSVVTYNKSPDIPFDRSINPYRGCEHGCIYCFARPSHAYLDLSPGLDFETVLFAKRHAPALLRQELAKQNYHCAPIALGVNTDAYQPVERRLGITRGVLEVLLESRHPVSIITKSSLIERDIDLLSDLADRRLVSVYVSITSLDEDLTRRLEPRAAGQHRRLKVIRRLAEAGVPVGVLVAPVIPMLTDADMERVLEGAAEAGAGAAGHIMLRLPNELGGLFQTWLQEHYPDRAERVLSRLREMRGGRLNDPRFGERMRGHGEYADMIRRRFDVARRRYGLAEHLPSLDSGQFRPPMPASGQMTLFP